MEKNISTQFNTLLDSGIQLLEPEHRYVLDSNSKIKFVSATAIVDKQFPKFNPIEVSRRLVSRVPKYQHLTPEKLRKEWNKKRDYGSKVHKEIENNILYNTKPSVAISRNAVKWLRDRYGDFELLTEVIIFDIDLKVAGTIDLIVIDKNHNSCILIDWKTTEKLTFNGFGGKTGITAATKDLQDSKYDHYCLQLSIYRFLLEEKWNIKVDKSYVLHLTPNKIKDYTARYYKANVRKIFKQI